MKIIGTRDDDTLIGTAGYDLLRGRGGVDILGGGLGDDLIFGGRGGDLIHGEQGADVLIGGRGKDVFLFSFDPNDPWLLNGDIDRIMDFKPGQDEIRLIDQTQSISDTPAALAYDPGTGYVSADMDGGGSGESIRIIRMQKHLALHDGDLMVY